MTKVRSAAFVVPRYGTEVIGGAEYAARMMAENFVSQLGMTVEVLTTTALDTDTWKNHFPVGDEVINGVTVRRFSVDHGRSSDFSSLSARLLKYPKSTTMDEAEQWIDAQGPVSFSLIDAITHCNAKAILFFPYLYHPMVRAIEHVRDRAILIPAAHDEPPAYLPVFKAMFQHAKALMFQTRAEERFVDSIFRVADKSRLRAGLGIERYPKPIEPIERLLPQLKGQPFLLTLGRVDQLKGATLLSELFAEYKRRNPGPLKLVFAGPVTTEPIEFPDIFTLGSINEELKWSLLKECLALVNPSAFESFSLVLFEAWSQQRPVIVNAQCQVTTDHVTESGGGLAFTTFADFETQINMLYLRPKLRDTLGTNGRRYLENNYEWPVVVDKISRFLETTLNP